MGDSRHSEIFCLNQFDNLGRCVILFEDDRVPGYSLESIEEHITALNPCHEKCSSLVILGARQCNHAILEVGLDELLRGKGILQPRHPICVG
jgi:hypothetical protein